MRVRARSVCSVQCAVCAVCECSYAVCTVCAVCAGGLHTCICDQMKRNHTYAIRCVCRLFHVLLQRNRFRLIRYIQDRAFLVTFIHFHAVPFISVLFAHFCALLHISAAFAAIAVLLVCLCCCCCSICCCCCCCRIFCICTVFCALVRISILIHLLIHSIRLQLSCL